jgi:hypothetical protein
MTLIQTTLPVTLQEQANTAWESILDRADASAATQLRSLAQVDPIAAQLPRMLACSPFVVDLARR